MADQLSKPLLEWFSLLRLKRAEFRLANELPLTFSDKNMEWVGLTPKTEAARARDQRNTLRKPSLPSSSFAVLLANVAADEPSKKEKATPTAAAELQRFQGTWNVEAWEEGGKALTEAELKKRGVFFGANIFIFRHEKKVLQGGTIQLDPGKTPATANLSVREGEGKDDVMLGIYSLDGDTLKLCFDPKGQNRPKDFKPEAKDGFTLYYPQET